MKPSHLPSDWRQAPLSSVADVQTGLALGKSSKVDPVRLPYLRVANVQDGFLDLSVIKEVEVERSQVFRYSLRQGDVLLTEGGDFDKLGRGFIWHDEIPNCLHQNHIFVVRPHAQLLSYFLAALTSSDYGRSYFQSCSKQSTNLASINSSQLKAFPVPLPDIREQKAITAVISTWDQGIRQLTDLIEAKVRFKQGLMQQLLAGKRRFPEFGEPTNSLHEPPRGWQRIKAGEVFGNYSQKANDGEELLSVTQDRGVIPRSMLEGRVVMPESGTDGYKLVEPGDFVISLRSFQGGLEYSKFRGLVSPAYTVLKSRRVINDAFFRHYFKSYDFIQRLAVAVIGIRDGKQISYSDFEFVRLPYPPLAEQERIANVIDVADREIDGGLKSQKQSRLRN